MPSILKHTECPACGHRHHFCFLGEDLMPGQEFEFRCPETSRPGKLRPAVAPEIFHSPPQGAVVLERVTGKSPSPPAVTASVGGTPSGDSEAGESRLLDVLPDVKELATKVGGMNNLSDIVRTLKDAKE